MIKYVAVDKIKMYLKRIYRITRSFEKQEELVWQDMKKLHASTDWRSGVFEKRRYIETVFTMAKREYATFYYMLYDGRYHCRVKLLKNFPDELATDVFILASHMNNILNNGIVTVNAVDKYVEFHQNRDLIIPLIYTDDIYDQFIRY
jgi:hypothetical protein